MTDRGPPGETSTRSIRFCPSLYGPLVHCQPCGFSLPPPPPLSCCSHPPLLLHGHFFHLWSSVTLAREKYRLKIHNHIKCFLTRCCRAMIFQMNYNSYIKPVMNQLSFGWWIPNAKDLKVRKQRGYSLFPCLLQFLLRVT